MFINIDIIRYICLYSNTDIYIWSIYYIGVKNIMLLDITTVINVTSLTQHDFSGYHGDGVSCLDDDECVTGDNTCQAITEYCLNNLGSYDCICETGYSRNSNGTCEGIS